MAEILHFNPILFRNRVRIFHGVNLVCKHPPWYYTKLLDEKYARNLGILNLSFF